MAPSRKPAVPTKAPFTYVAEHYASPEAFFASCRDEAKADDISGWDDYPLAQGRQWSLGGDQSPELVDAFREGRRIAEDRLGPIMAESSTWELDYAGARPSVPHYLAGADRAMYRRTDTASESAPLRVFVSGMTDWAIPKRAVAKRAGIIAGAIDILGERRPVSLVVYYAGGIKSPVCLSWDQPTRDASIVLAQLAYARWGMHKVWAERHSRTLNADRHDQARFWLQHDSAERQNETVRTALGADPGDIVIPVWVFGPPEDCLSAFEGAIGGG